MRSVRSECLDRLLILNQQHLERILCVFQIITAGTGHIERWVSCHLTHGARRLHRRRHLSTLAFCAGIILAVSCTSTLWRRDQVFAPYTRWMVA